MELTEAKKAWAFVASEREVELMDPSMRPRRCRHVEFRQEGDLVREVDAVWRTCFIDEEDGRNLSILLPLLDGQRTIDEISAAAGMDPRKGCEIIQSLYEYGLVVSCGDTPIPARAFCSHAVSVGKMWQDRLAQEAGLGAALGSHQLTRHLLLGHLVNLYHYVSAAASHISPAIVAAPNERLRLMLSEYLSEEYWHGVTLAAGLQAAGLSKQDIARSQPLPATQGVISYQRQLALTDVLGYFIVLGLNEISEDEDPHEIRARWQHLEDTGLVPAETLQPFRDHEVLDLEEGHADLSAEAFVDLAPLSRPQQESLFQVTVTLTRLQAASFAAVLQHYRNESSPLLMLPCWD